MLLWNILFKNYSPFEEHNFIHRQMFRWTIKFGTVTVIECTSIFWYPIFIYVYHTRMCKGCPLIQISN